MSEQSDRIELLEKDLKKLRSKVAKIKDLEDSISELDLLMRNMKEDIERLKNNAETIQNIVQSPKK